MILNISSVFRTSRIQCVCDDIELFQVLNEDPKNTYVSLNSLITLAIFLNILFKIKINRILCSDPDAVVLMGVLLHLQPQL